MKCLKWSLFHFAETALPSHLCITVQSRHFLPVTYHPAVLSWTCWCEIFTGKTGLLIKKKKKHWKRKAEVDRYCLGLVQTNNTDYWSIKEVIFTEHIRRNLNKMLTVKRAQQRKTVSHRLRHFIKLKFNLNSIFFRFSCLIWQRLLYF